MGLQKLSLLVLVTAGTAVPQFPVLYAPIAAFFIPPRPPMPMGVPIPVLVPAPIINVKPICLPTTKCPPCPCKPKTISPNCGCKCLHPILPIPSNPSGIIASYLPPLIPPYLPSYKRPHIKKPTKYISSSSSSEISSDTDDSGWDSYNRRRRKRRRRKWRKRKGKKKKYGIFRASGRRLNNNIRDQKLQPVISYVSENGDVKFRRRINKENAALLLQKELLDGKPNHKSRTKLTTMPR